MHSLFFPTAFRSFSQDDYNIDNSVRILESEQAFLVELQVPGFINDDFQIAASTHALTIRAEKASEVPEGFRLLRRGDRAETIEKSFRFRQYIAAKDVEANVKDGVLQLRLPKKSVQTVVEVKAS